MIDKYLAESTYRDKEYQKKLADWIVAHIRANDYPNANEAWLAGLLRRYGFKGTDGYFGPEIIGFIKYLLSSRQTIYYYWKKNSL